MGPIAPVRAFVGRPHRSGQSPFAWRLCMLGDRALSGVPEQNHGSTPAAFTNLQPARLAVGDRSDVADFSRWARCHFVQTSVVVPALMLRAWMGSGIFINIFGLTQLAGQLRASIIVTGDVGWCVKHPRLVCA